MKKVLVFTNERDVHCDAVAEKIRERGADIIRVNTEKFAINFSIDVYNNKLGKFDYKLNIFDSKIKFDSNDFVSIWYRKPLPLEFELDENNPELNQYKKIEFNTFLNEFYALNYYKRWVNSVIANTQASNKLVNLEIAQKLGLIVPRTLVTNNPEEAEKFAIYNNWNIIVKPFRSAGVQIGDSFLSPYSNKVAKDDFLRYRETIKFVPTFIQQYIEKEIELRVTVVGEKFYTAAIFSQQNPLTIHDFRADSGYNVKHEIFVLPDDIKTKLLEFNKHYNLIFSTFDLILTPEKEFVFLECNPNGQWLWIEDLIGLPISNALAEELLSH